MTTLLFVEAHRLSPSPWRSSPARRRRGHRVRRAGRRRSHAARQDRQVDLLRRRRPAEDLLLPADERRGPADQRAGRSRGCQGSLQKVRFEISEKYLIGYRAYDYVPGSQNPFTGTGEQHRHAAPHLRDHVALRRQARVQPRHRRADQRHLREHQRPALGPAPVHARRLVEEPGAAQRSARPAAELSPDPLAPLIDGRRVSTDWYVSETDTRNPEYADRPIFTNDYIDFVSREIRTPDLGACIALLDAVFDDDGLWGCGEAEIKVRHSFLEVKPSTYEPLEYPDNYPLLDAQGKPIQLLAGGAPCTNQVIQTTGRVQRRRLQRRRGGRLLEVRLLPHRPADLRPQVRRHRAGPQVLREPLEHLGGHHPADADGAPVLDANGAPGACRTAAQDQADRLLHERRVPGRSGAASPRPREVTDGLERRDEADGRRAASPPRPTATRPSTRRSWTTCTAAQRPDMVDAQEELLQPAPRVKAFLAAYPDVADQVEKAVGQSRRRPRQGAPARRPAASLEAATQKLADGDTKKFTWQRNGDLRYSFLHWVDRPQAAGPLGYGPSSADPETGEIISASLYIYGAALDTYAQFAADTVDLLNQHISVDDLLSGKTIADVLQETRRRSATRDGQAAHARGQGDGGHAGRASRRRRRRRRRAPGRLRAQVARAGSVASTTLDTHQGDRRRAAAA